MDEGDNLPLSHLYAVLEWCYIKIHKQMHTQKLINEESKQNYAICANISNTTAFSRSNPKSVMTNGFISTSDSCKQVWIFLGEYVAIYNMPYY